MRAAASDAGSLRDTAAFAAAAHGFLLQSNGYTGRIRRNYAFVRLAKDGLIINTDVQAFARRRLDDDAWIFGWWLRWQANEHSALALSGEHLRGSAGSEAVLVPVRDRYQISFNTIFKQRFNPSINISFHLTGGIMKTIGLVLACMLFTGCARDFPVSALSSDEQKSEAELSVMQDADAQLTLASMYVQHNRIDEADGILSDLAVKDAKNP